MISSVPKSWLSKSEEEALTRGLTEYYASSPVSYYARAEAGAADYSPEALPFHHDLIGRVRPGMKVLELGCGSAHLCPYVLEAGGEYTGVDHGAELLATNRQRYPSAKFQPVGTPFADEFDLVTSLYTIEHVVDPPAYLETLWSVCRPEGLIAIICPDFVDGEGLPPSFFFGRSSRRFREKVASLSLLDAAAHLLDLFWFAPRWKSRARAASAGAFWINRKPRILHGGPAAIDADAVHLPRLRDLVWWFQEKKAVVLETSNSLGGGRTQAAKHNCYVLVQKKTGSR